MPKGSDLTEGWLSQFGTDWFREVPRHGKEFDISAVVGRLTVQETVYAALGRPASGHHTVRYFEVPNLLSATYRCIHSTHQRKPLHASIMAPVHDQDVDSHKRWWDRLDRVTLNVLATP